jgi:hypothetical protein
MIFSAPAEVGEHPAEAASPLYRQSTQFQAENR